MQRQEQKSNKTDFEELLLRRESKNNFDSKEFTKVKLTDVSVYQGYKFSKAKEYFDDALKADYISVISKYDSAEKTLREYLDFSDTNNITSTVSKDDYISKFNNKRTCINNKDWIYTDNDYIVVTISSIDENYENKYIIKSKKINRSTDELYKEIYDKLDSTCLIGSPTLSDKVLRFDEKQPLSRMQRISNSILRFISLSFIPILTIIGMTYVGFQYIPSVYLIPYVAVILFVISLSMAATIPIGNIIYKNWFNLKSSDMLSNLPEDAEISNKFKQNKEYKFEDANVDIYDNGDVIISVNDITWTFENNDNIPSQKAVELYNQYGVDFNNEENIPIMYYESTQNDDSYISDCGNWVLEPDVA